MTNNNEEKKRGRGNCCDECWNSKFALKGKNKEKFGCGLACECHNKKSTQKEINDFNGTWDNETYVAKKNKGKCYTENCFLPKGHEGACYAMAPFNKEKKCKCGEVDITDIRNIQHECISTLPTTDWAEKLEADFHEKIWIQMHLPDFNGDLVKRGREEEIMYRTIVNYLKTSHTDLARTIRDDLIKQRQEIIGSKWSEEYNRYVETNKDHVLVEDITSYFKDRFNV